jgi:hypothetical protein
MRNALLSGSLILLAGCNLMPAPGDRERTPPADDKEVVSPVSEQAYWDEIAKHIEAGSYNSSDEVVLAANQLKNVGRVKDLTRLDAVSKKRYEPLTGEGKDLFLKAVRGK